MAEDSPKSEERNHAVKSEMPRQGAVSDDVFVSYASQDGAVANAIVAALEKQGIRCWIAPRDVVPGSLYADEIVGAINDAKAVVLVLSQHSVASPHVGKEIERASSKRRRIIAFHIDSAPLTRGFEYFLSESQWIDVGAGGMDAAIGKLVEAVRRHLDSSAAIEPRAQPEPSTAVTRAKVPSARWVVACGATVVSLVLAYFGVQKFWMSKPIAEEKPIVAAVPATVPASPAIPEKSVAVLPFVDMSEKKDQEYFSDGLTEELIDHLSQAADLKVIARTSSFQFKGKNEDMRIIASKLGVAHVLEGSVRKSGRALRISAQLIRAADGTHLWSHIYERNLADVFRLQDEIAAKVAQSLKVTLHADRPGSEIQPANTEAYNLFLQGNFLLEHSNEADTEKAIELYQQAIRLDPKLAIAWAKLSSAYWFQTSSGWMPTRDGIAKAKKAVERSLSIDPNLASAHVVLGKLYRDFDWDWKAARTEFERARELAPHDPSIAVAHASLLALEYGQFDEVIAAERQVLSRNPVDASSFCFSGLNLYFAGRLEESVAMWRKALLLNPTFVGAHGMLAITLVKSGRSIEALAVVEEEPDEPWKLTASPIVNWSLGRRSESDAALHLLESKYAAGSAYSIAEVHAYRGEVDTAIAWLERAYQQRDSELVWSKADPLFRDLHGDQRYNTLLDKMKLPQ